MVDRYQNLRSSTPNTAPLAASRSVGEIWMNFPDLQFGVIDASQNAQPLLAVRLFSTTTAYSAGHFVVQGGILYAAKSLIPAGPFVPAQWTAITTVDTLNSSLANYLPLAGGTLSGTLNATSVVTTNGIVMNNGVGLALYGGSGTARVIRTGNSPAVPRWDLRMGDGASETGANAGSNFTINPFDDAGNALPIALTIVRATNAVQLAGSLTISPPSTANPSIALNGANTRAKQISSFTSGSLRWLMALGDTASESGSNAGSNFAINSYTDAGVYITSPLVINRANSTVNMAAALGVGGSLNVSSTVACKSQVQIISTGGDAATIYYDEQASPVTRGTVSWRHSDGAMVVWDAVGGGLLYVDQNTRLFFNGGAFKPGGGAWADSSDIRIKNVVGDYAFGLEEVLQLNPVRYTFKGNDTPSADVNDATRGPDEPKSTVTTAPYPASYHCDAAVKQTEYVGFIAQELETVFPDMVTEQDGFIDGEATPIKHVDTTSLIYALVNAVKTLTARIQVLEGASARKPG